MKNSHVITLVLAAALTGCAEVSFTNVSGGVGTASAELKAACQAEFARAVAGGAQIGPPQRGAAIANEYIVASRGISRRGGVSASAASMAAQIASMSDVKIREVSEGAMPRVLVEMSPERAEELSSDPELMVEPNQVFTVSSDMDLMVTDFRASSTNTTPGGTITFQVKVKNTGSLTSGIIGIAVQLEDDKGVARAVCKAAEIGPSTETTVGVDVSIPKEGSYRARAIADATGAVKEISKTNNTAGPMAITVASAPPPPRPDLIVSMDLANVFATPNVPLAIQFRVTNQGEGAAPGSRIALFRNAQTEPPSTATPDANVDVPALQPGASVTVIGSLTFTTAGAQAVRAIVDRDNAIPESNETNNSAGPTSLSVAVQRVPTGIRRMNVHKSSVRAGDGTGTLEAENLVVAVIDTGIDLEYTTELNVVGNQSFVGGTGDDGNGHGTHVAGTVGAYDNNVGVVGVAPGIKLYAVRVLGNNGSGTAQGVINGINFACAQANVKVVNMSLGGGFSQMTNNAVRACVDAGITVVVAAGNENQDAANVSPASEPTAITVGALADYNGLPGGGAPATVNAGADDTFATFSNFGMIVDVMAPGVAILSTQNNGGTTSLSGTSMASPHIAGLAALHLIKNPTATPAQVAAGILQTANTVLKRGNAGRDYPIANAETY